MVGRVLASGSLEQSAAVTQRDTQTNNRRRLSTEIQTDLEMPSPPETNDFNDSLCTFEVMGSTPPSDHGTNTPLESEIDLERLTRVLERHPVRLAVLFGSTVHGTATDQSDIDIAVAFESDLGPDERLEQHISLIVSLTDALGTDAIDVADLEAIHPGVGLAALENGYVIIENPTLREHLKEDYENSYPEEEETHEERMRRFDSLLSRLEGQV